MDLRSQYAPLVASKLVSVQKHPTVDLFIYNYTQKCQFDHLWTDLTIQARGLILDGQGNVVARPFKKFFNYEEHLGEDSLLPKFPIEEFEVTEKVDGSLGILFWIDRKPFIATRGSFTSDQAIEGNKILQQYKVDFKPEYTYLFEIIYPENQIVVNYHGERVLYLLAVIETQTGKEMPYEQMLKLYGGEIPLVKRFKHIIDLQTIKARQEDNKEGFVVRFKSGLRVKIKFDEYVRLHRLVTGVNKKTIWELLKNDQPFDELLDRVPDEFYYWIKETQKELKQAYLALLSEANRTRVSIYAQLEKDKSNLEPDTTSTSFDVFKLKRKAVALEFIKYPKLQKIMFAMHDRKDHHEIIWKMIRPKADKPFKEQVEAVA